MNESYQQDDLEECQSMTLLITLPNQFNQQRQSFQSPKLHHSTNVEMNLGPAKGHNIPTPEGLSQPHHATG